MSDLQTRAQQLIDQGYRPVPVRGKQIAYPGDTRERDYAPEQFKSGYVYTPALSRGALLAASIEQLCAGLGADRGDRAEALGALFAALR
jgi:hypothetical protein